MDRLPRIREWFSKVLVTRVHGERPYTAAALQWLTLAALFIFVALLVERLLQGNILSATVISAAILAILVSLVFVRRGKVAVPSAFLAVTFTFLVTWLTSNGNGIYDIGIIAFPVILLVSGLIMQEKFIAYLTVLILLCLAWLVFGPLLGVFQPDYPDRTFAQDFFLASTIILIASNSVYLLIRNVHESLEHAEQEIKARKAVETEREKLIQELKSKNQELNRFAITVSHDLKTPLITMSGYLGYLQRDARAGNFERMERDIVQINTAAKQMGTFVDQILDLSRIGRIVNPPADVRFAAVVQEALQLAEGPIQARQVRVQVEPQLPIVHVDRVRMVQVMQNLITNSVKFMGAQESPCIEIGMQQPQEERVFFVRDNGVGIAPDHQQDVFEIFNKLDSSTDGSGIGLALVKRIIEVHGGRIWVESEPGKGATFFFTLGQQLVKEKS